MGILSGIKATYNQANPFDSGRTWETSYANKGTLASHPSATPANTTAGRVGTFLPNPVPTSQTDPDWMAQMKADNAALMAALKKANSTPVPKLAKFDTLANWRNSKSAAESAVSPLYERKMQEFLANQTAKKDIRNKQFNLTNENTDLALNQSLEDSATNRTRTTEDVAGAIDKINKTEGNFQQDEGAAFDANYRKAAEELAATGASGTGLGRQQSRDAVKLRNITSQRELDEFQGQRQAKEIFKTRTFEDLARGDERAGKLAENTKKAAQFDMDSYLQDLAYDQQTFTMDNEQNRQTAILQSAKEIERSNLEQFLASLAGNKAYSAQDIAYNRQVYL